MLRLKISCTLSGVSTCGPAVAALVQQHLHPVRHIRRCRGGRAGRAHGVLVVARDQHDLLVDQGVRGGGVGVLEVMDRGARARHIQRRVQALLDQLVPRYTGDARGDLAGQKDAGVAVLGYLAQAVARLEVAQPVHDLGARVAEVVERDRR